MAVLLIQHNLSTFLVYCEYPDMVLNDAPTGTESVLGFGLARWGVVPRASAIMRNLVPAQWGLASWIFIRV